MNNNFIMISGPAASGKSTLVYKMKDALNGFVFKPSLAYVELAKNNGIRVISKKALSIGMPLFLANST